MTEFVVVTARLGALRWVELRSFEILGSWVAQTPAAEAETRVLWNALSAHHAWRADLVGSRMSIAREHPAEAATVGSPGGQALVAALLAAPPEGPCRLEIVARELLPRLVTGYRSLIATATPASDEPVGRIARIASADVLDDWQRAQELLDRVRGAGIPPI